MSGCGGPECTDGGCDNSIDDIITFPPSDCGPQGCADCGLEGCSDCVDGSCGGVPNSGGCSGADCPDYPVSAGSGRCLNGGTSLNNGFCACQPGYYGSQCENGKADRFHFSFSTPEIFIRCHTLDENMSTYF